jgi:hypothetical protein
MGLRGPKPGQRPSGRQKGTPNKRSLPAIQAAIRDKNPDLDSLSLQRFAAAAILEQIDEARKNKKCSPGVLIDWYAKLARAAAGYASLDRDEPHDLLQIRADLDRLTPEQLLALKTIALIAAGGSAGGEVPGGTAAPVRRIIQGKARREGEGKDPSKRADGRNSATRGASTGTSVTERGVNNSPSRCSAANRVGR